MALDIQFAVFAVCCVLNIPAECVTYDRYNHGLSEIPQDIPLDVTSINLNKNSIRSIGANAFSKFTDLQQLNLNQNGIIMIHDDAFSGLQRLETLLLDGNGLQKVPKLEDLALYQLNLQRNQIQLNEEDFEHVAIKHLYISNNQIYNHLSAISKLADSLLVLNIGNNPLGKSSPAELYSLIKSLHKASRIYMTDSGITSLPDLRPLTLRLDIVSNPLNCDCRMLWMRGDSYYADIQCASPKKFELKFVSEIATEDLCPGGQIFKIHRLLTIMATASIISLHAVGPSLYAINI